MIVGIDLGTTHSLCAVFTAGQPALIPNAHGDVLTPSIVGVLDDDRVVVGAAAAELRITKPQRCAACFKRWMGTDRSVELGGRTFRAVDLSGIVLRALREDAEAHLGVPVTDAVISVPAYFNDLQRKATKHAGELAGLKVRRIINEPTAAALAYGFHEPQSEKHLLVIDLGGGTFDVTLMEIFEGTLEIVSTAGESFLGGEDFTDRLVAAALRHEGALLELVEVREPQRLARLRAECEQAKRTLQDEPHARIRLPDANGEFGAEPRDVRVSREQFAKLTANLMERLSAPTAKSLRDADLTADDVDEVILVGGATRMRLIHDFVREQLHCEPQQRFNPDEVVALGAAVQAALIDDDAAVSDLVMTDVCPFTLGVEVVKEFGRQHHDGYFAPIIHRNSTIPCSREEIMSTIVANQDHVVVRVFQGEARRIKDNIPLGELRVSNIPPGPAGTPIHIRFTYDLNGILEVEAYLPSASRKFRAVLTNNAAGMSEDDIAEAVERLQALKFYPRDDLRNQRLILFCERAIGEIGPFHRQELEEAIDMFEVALSSGDRDHYDRAHAGLMMMLSQLGLEYDELQESDDGDLDDAN